MEDGRPVRPGSKKLLQFGAVGLAIAGILIAGVQLQPSSSPVSPLLTRTGTVVFDITDSPALLSTPIPCNPCTVTGLNVTIDSLEAHTEGVFNLTSGWISVPLGPNPYTADLMRLKNIVRLLGSIDIPETTINVVRLHVSSASATLLISIVGLTDITTNVPVRLEIPQGKLDGNLSSAVQVTRGTTSTIIVNFQPTVTCEGLRLTNDLSSQSGKCKLVPALHSSD